MAAITTPSISSLIKQLKADYPQFKFVRSDIDAWDPTEATIYYHQKTPHLAQVLHELGHALLAHTVYSRDIELLAMEREAWVKANSLAHEYDVKIDPEDAETHMDSYRDWLHARSTCPGCQTTGIEVDTKLYRCLACASEWRVNDARTCALRRYTIKKP